MESNRALEAFSFEIIGGVRKEMQGIWAHAGVDLLFSKDKDVSQKAF